MVPPASTHYKILKEHRQQQHGVCLAEREQLTIKGRAWTEQTI
jgi:hypothetical protein